ncbi:MAG: glycosyltransferase family 4 protein [Chloroflexi bacterium]|nr:glycosyltransferase family 4 protein [Chloroflexota bacterium]
MKLLFIADGRSQIALNWMRYFIEGGYEVHLASIYLCRPDLDLASLTVIPVAFSGVVGDAEQGSMGAGMKGKIVRKLATPAVRTWLRHRFVPRSLPKAAENLQSLISNLQPDLIHAMRIPYEGMLSALALSGVSTADFDRLNPPLDARLLVSVWGNDFTLHAPATRALARLTRLTLARADALHTDCQNDMRLAREWGFSAEKPAITMPGAGGIQRDLFFPVDEPPEPVVINPRGLRAYVRNDTFFQAVPRVLESLPGARFICPAMQNQPEAESWASRLGAGESLSLLPRLRRDQMADTYRQAQVVLSITEHDGTPNSLLEALACGCLPIAGDIPSLREWITPGVNGLLVDPADPQALADAILTALGDAELRARAREINLHLIGERAEYRKVMGAAERFYMELIGAGV